MTVGAVSGYHFTMKTRVALLIFYLLFLSTVAFADPVDELERALRSDPSYKVRAQAAIVLGNLKDPRGVPLLLRALQDPEASVRVVAASALGKLGDPAALAALRACMSDTELPVRTAAGKAISAIEAGRDPGRSGTASGGRPRFALEVSPTMGSKGDPKLAQYAHAQILSQLRQLNNIALTPEPGVPRYFIDTTISRVSASPPKGNRVTVECDVGVIIATYPTHAMKVMAQVGGCLDEANDPKGIAEAKNFCLSDAAKQVAEKVQSYLKGVQ